MTMHTLHQDMVLYLREISLDAYEGDPCVVSSKVFWNVKDEGMHTIELCNSACTLHWLVSDQHG